VTARSCCLVPEVSRAARTLRRQQHRHHADTISALYRDVRECLTNDWRGLGWHTHLAKRWEAWQQILRPDTAGKDRYFLARTEHWSMLPEAAAIISVLANHHHDALTGQRHLTRSLSRALHLDSYWSTGTADHFDAHHILMPLRRHLAEQTRVEDPPSKPTWTPQPGVQDRSASCRIRPAFPVSPDPVVISRTPRAPRAPYARTTFGPAGRGGSRPTARRFGQPVGRGASLSGSASSAVISDSRNLRCPPGVRMDPRRPVIAHRVTVFGSTRNIRATSAEVSNRSTPSNGDLSPTLSSRICHAMGHVESGHSAPCVPVRPRVSRTSRPVVGSATRRCPARAVTVESGAGDDPGPGSRWLPPAGQPPRGPRPVTALGSTSSDGRARDPPALGCGYPPSLGVGRMAGASRVRNARRARTNPATQCPQRCSAPGQVDDQP